MLPWKINTWLPLLGENPVVEVVLSKPKVTARVPLEGDTVTTGVVVGFMEKVETVPTGISVPTVQVKNPSLKFVVPFTIVIKPDPSHPALVKLMVVPAAISTRLTIEN